MNKDIEQGYWNDTVRYAVYKITKNKTHINHHSLSVMRLHVTIAISLHSLSFQKICHSLKLLQQRSSEVERG